MEHKKDKLSDAQKKAIEHIEAMRDDHLRKAVEAHDKGFHSTANTHMMRATSLRVRSDKVREGVNWGSSVLDGDPQ